MGLLPNRPSPNFTGTAVVNRSIKTIRLSDYMGKYIVLLFYPGDFTFVCSSELIAFSDRIEEFKSRNCEVIGCSTDSTYAHLQWIKMERENGGLGPINIPLLADRNKTITKMYEILDEESGSCYRGLYIIDKKRILRHITINDFKVGRSVDETLRTLDAFQFVEIQGSECPADWKHSQKESGI